MIFLKKAVPEKSYEIRVPRPFKAENKKEAGAATRVGLISHECFPKGSDNL
jgi:hypothetical protein